MRAGSLDRQITIQQASVTLDSYGQPSESWSTFATVNAWKREPSARERFTSNQRVAQETVTFRTRYLDGVTPKMRISYDGRTYDILGVTELGRRDGLDLYAEARTDG